MGPFILPIVVLAGLVWERVSPGWQLPRVPGWGRRAGALFFLQVSVVVANGVLWERVVQAPSLLSLSAWWGTWGAGAIAYLLSTCLFYWWHRWRHESAWLWRVFHQVHHSPARLEGMTAYYKHPLEMAVNAQLGSLLVYPLLGLSVEAAALYTLLSAAGDLFYHLNIRTPYLLGYVFQRPEMHRVHHQRDRHGRNYGDLALWDMLFGTWENPRKWEGDCGFGDEREQRLGDMIACRDLAERRAPR